jgi:hypothetical protein
MRSKPASRRQSSSTSKKTPRIESRGHFTSSGSTGFELNGSGAQLINTTMGSTLLVSDSSRVTIRDLAIDYDPLPFTQGTIVGFDRAALEIMVKVDPGYPDDPNFLATIADGFFKVMDRKTRALKPGARDFLSPKRVGSCR